MWQQKYPSIVYVRFHFQDTLDVLRLTVARTAVFESSDESSCEKVSRTISNDSSSFQIRSLSTLVRTTHSFYPHHSVLFLYDWTAHRTFLFPLLPKKIFLWRLLWVIESLSHSIIAAMKRFLSLNFFKMRGYVRIFYFEFTLTSLQWIRNSY